MYVIVTFKGLALKLWWCGGHLKLRLSHDTGMVWKVFKFYCKEVKSYMYFDHKTMSIVLFCLKPDL